MVITRGATAPPQVARRRVPAPAARPAPGRFPRLSGRRGARPGHSPVHRAGCRPYGRSVHAEHASPAGGHDAGEYGERAETYLRMLAEAVLRPAGPLDADRVRRAAEILVDAGAVTDQRAARILTDLEIALRVRARSPMRGIALPLRRLSGFHPGQMPGLLPGLLPGQPGTPGAVRVLPAGPATPGSRLMALIITSDRALAPVTLFFAPDGGLPESGIPPFAGLTGTDDLGSSYRLGFTDGGWAGSAWTGTVMFLPKPPAAARWLAIISPNAQLLRADITTAPAGGATPRPALEPATESPGERLLARQAEAMLTALTLGYPPGRIQASLAGMVATLEAAGALSPLSPAPARLAALGQLLGLPVQGRAEQVPARWLDVMTYYGRRRRPAPFAGTAAIAAELPELDGTRLAIAGLRSGGSGTFLHILVIGPGPLPLRRTPRPPWDAGFSWWARDDAGCWHLGALEDVSPVGETGVLLRLALLPPLDHATSTLTVQIAGSAGQITANLPVRW
jgi:hypothetical protein